jgi:hypothetical protein
MWKKGRKVCAVCGCGLFEAVVYCNNCGNDIVRYRCVVCKSNNKKVV